MVLTHSHGIFRYFYRIRFRTNQMKHLSYIVAVRFFQFFHFFFFGSLKWKYFEFLFWSNLCYSIGITFQTVLFISNSILINQIVKWYNRPARQLEKQITIASISDRLWKRIHETTIIFSNHFHQTINLIATKYDRRVSAL